MPSVLLVSLPWATLTEPSLGLGLLRAVLDQQGIPCRVLHMNLFLLQHLHAHTYNTLARVNALNDFLFSGSLDPGITHVQQRHLWPKVRELLNRGLIDPRRFGGPEGLVAILLRLRHEIIPSWLDGWANEIACHEANLVGFTCMFDQTIASLAFAKMVHERAPEKMLVLGGYAVRAPTAHMIIRSNSWIDAICTGEGEATIVELARATAGDIALGDVPGIVFRSASGEPVETPPPRAQLEANPVPNFDDFFTDVRRLSSEHLIDIEPSHLPIENSRGCWWGAKNHCVFCGIHEEDLTYRARQAEAVLTTMSDLRGRYGISSFRFCDYILPRQYFETLLPTLVQLGRPYHLSAEIKANITEEQLVLLAQAGFEEVQPGIESFSSDVLRKMRKGVSAAQNVYLLVLGRRFGVRIRYNLLYGFPDDEVSEYERMATLLPQLAHLDAPSSCLPVQITRYAPLQTQPSRFGIEAADPESSYEMVFSRGYLERSGFDVAEYCYYFERPFENAPRLQRIYDQMNAIVHDWRTKCQGDAAWLYAIVDDEGGIVHDKRTEGEKIYRLRPPLSRILIQCQHPTTIQALKDANPTLPDIEEAVAELERLWLLFRDGTRLVSLIMDSPPSPAIKKATDELPLSPPA